MLTAIALAPDVLKIDTVPVLALTSQATHGLYNVVPGTIKLPANVKSPTPLSVAMGVVLSAYHLNCPLDVAREFHIVPKSTPIAKSSSVATVDG